MQRLLEQNNQNKRMRWTIDLTLSAFLRTSLWYVLLNFLDFLHWFTNLENHADQNSDHYNFNGIYFKTSCLCRDFLLLSFGLFGLFSRTRWKKILHWKNSKSISNYLIASCRWALRNSGCWLRLAKISFHVTPVIARWNFTVRRVRFFTSCSATPFLCFRR